MQRGAASFEQSEAPETCCTITAGLILPYPPRPQITHPRSMPPCRLLSAHRISIAAACLHLYFACTADSTPVYFLARDSCMHDTHMCLTLHCCDASHICQWACTVTVLHSPHTCPGVAAPPAALGVPARRAAAAPAVHSARLPRARRWKRAARPERASAATSARAPAGWAEGMPLRLLLPGSGQRCSPVDSGGWRQHPPRSRAPRLAQPACWPYRRSACSVPCSSAASPEESPSATASAAAVALLAVITFKSACAQAAEGRHRQSMWVLAAAAARRGGGAAAQRCTVPGWRSGGRTRARLGIRRLKRHLAAVAIR